MSDDAVQLAFERAFHSLLWRLRPRDLQRGVEWLMSRAKRQAFKSGLPLHDELQLTYFRAREQTVRRLVRPSSLETSKPRLQQRASTLNEAIVAIPRTESADFHCDSGLGGLARWLRAYGYDARFWSHIDDGELIRETLGSSAILLTTDQPLMQRSAVTWGGVAAVLVPLNLGKLRQFADVVERLGLPRKPPRCMACGGALCAVAKESVRDRIPPRTYPWLDEFYECDRCAKLFWPGTHWQHVRRQLAAL